MSEEKSARYCGQYVPIQGIMFADYEAAGTVGMLEDSGDERIKMEGWERLI